MDAPRPPPSSSPQPMHPGAIWGVSITVVVITAALTAVIVWLIQTQKQRLLEAVAPPAGTSSTFAFPNATPLVLPPPPDPTQHACYDMCPAPGGGFAPCASSIVRPCESDDDCRAAAGPNCDKAVCQTLADWPGVAGQQAALNNQSAKYCLPPRGACFTSTSPAAPAAAACANLAATDVDGKSVCLQACAQDKDCAGCSDDAAGVGRSLGCQYVRDGTRVTTLDGGGREPAGGRVLPAQSEAVPARARGVDRGRLDVQVRQGLRRQRVRRAHGVLQQHGDGRHQGHAEARD